MVGGTALPSKTVGAPCRALTENWRGIWQKEKDKKEKPLDKMTATELRKYALDLGEITGVHGMNKEELLSAIKKVKGIADEGKKAAKTVNMRVKVEKVKELRAQKAAACEAGSPTKRSTFCAAR
jgi:hypothetical protein